MGLFSDRTEMPYKAAGEPDRGFAPRFALGADGRGCRRHLSRDKTRTWLLHLLSGQASAASFERSKPDDLVSLSDDFVTPARVFGIDPVQPHAQAVFDHRYRVVAETAQRADVFKTFLHNLFVGEGRKVVFLASMPVGDVLAGDSRRFTEDAEMVVAIEPP